MPRKRPDPPRPVRCLRPARRTRAACYGALEACLAALAVLGAAASASAQPTGLMVTAGDGSLTAQWTAVLTAERYEVQHRLKTSNWPSTDTDVPNTSTSYTFSNLVNGSLYEVRVRVVTEIEGVPVASNWSTPVEGTPASSNANLSGLTASNSTSAAGTFTSLSLTPSFLAATTSYTATVANGITHLKLTPTVDDTGATVTVGGTTVSSGSASGAIALSVGNNQITVQVTAQDGTTNDYTVTVTRQAAIPTVSVTFDDTDYRVIEGESLTITVTLNPAATASR